MENISEDLLGEILGRIADKDAVRCKSVCKSWHRIISKEYFLLRFWPKSPVAGFYIRTLKPADKGPFNWTLDRWGYINHLIRSADFHNTNFVSFGTGQWNRQLYDDDGDGDDFLLLDCCNGLQLLFNSSLSQYMVYNPTTKQQSYITKARAHLEKSHFLAALAFDPTESLHYRVVRLSDPQPISDYKLDLNNIPLHASDVRPMIENLDHIGPNASVVLDLFCSETTRWVRYRLQLGDVFTSTSIMFWRHFTYLGGVLYWMVSSSKILCIDLNNVVPHTQTPTQIDLPSRKIEADVSVPGIDPLRLTTDRSDMCPVGCFGVSMNHLYYCRRESGAFCVWFYNDDNEYGGEWVVKFRVSIRRVVLFLRVRLKCWFTDVLWIEPIALSPNADILFIGTNESILSYHFETKQLQFVYGRQPLAWNTDTAVATCFFPFFLLRPCLVQFCKLDDDDDDDEVTTASTVSC
ncbi:hypothetical protein FEM48_Zijuj02G0186100 [Ziziphus jujuba var. spinosa]|uniref:F-box domain-containing protein n=1 Tax=Ziziphus jujuba var. spinosa TaxID=714518 RepID=A0A978VXB1_ZIZJJ|nr:hypothetical protein FEM48_Zijuj02G0186100 [Ziziphus jujuba var. spinosa]